MTLSEKIQSLTNLELLRLHTLYREWRLLKFEKKSDNFLKLKPYFDLAFDKEFYLADFAVGREIKEEIIKRYKQLIQESEGT